MHLLYALSRCPLCRQRTNTNQGCCAFCASQLFSTRLENNSLSLGPYQGKLEQAVKTLKFRGGTKLANLFGDEIAAAVAKQGWPITLVTAVPLHYQRRLGRGYNQSALIARRVAQRLERPYVPVLKRHRPTKQQARLTRQERQKNVVGAFSSRVVKGQHILLIDDVITSGATISECGKTLYAAGAHSVYLASVAKTI